MLTQLIHNGVVIPKPPPPIGLVLTIQGNRVPLSPKQEEMALAWAKKQGTPYVEDRTFVLNFMTDFCQELGLDVTLSLDEVDFGPAIRVVEAERAAKARLTKEERKALAAERKAAREALREQYGYALVDGEQVPLANYVVEPGGIFMGRGRHPLRGRWKEGAKHADVTLNLSPDASQPEDPWGAIIWQPESLWVARWQDKLSGKLKYVWLSDTAPIKQEREARKFDQAHELHAHLGTVREQIEQDLVHPDPKQRMLATACYLIDVLCLRVGDEKDADEADTVGATTLRPEHIKFREDGSTEFRFLGKDSVLWHKSLTLQPVVHDNLEALIDSARPSNSGNGREKPQVFPDISSRDVNAYLSEILSGLTAKVFRTHHATMAVRDSLRDSGIVADDPEHRKWEAVNLANLEAAVLCNHTKKAPASWPRSQARYKERYENAEERVKVYRDRLKAYREALANLRQEAREKTEAATPKSRDAVKVRYEKRLGVAQRRIDRARQQLDKALTARDKVKIQSSIAYKKRTWNLGTSLKSYIDPRVPYQWGQTVEYDVIERYYPRALREKFAWVQDEGRDGRDGRDSDPEDSGLEEDALG